MADTNTLGSLLQGISEQPQHLRQDGQVTEQINLLSHVVEGITTRPGSRLTGINSVPFGNKYKTITMDGEYLQIGTNDKARATNASNPLVTILNESGIPQTVLISPEAEDYIGEDMDVYVYDNKDVRTTYLVNRDFITAMSTDVTAQQAEVVKDIILITSLGGLFGHTYSVTLTYPDGDTVTSSYTTPEGLDEGDAARTSSDYIIARLAAGLRGSGSLAADIDDRTGIEYRTLWGTDFEFDVLPTDTVQTGVLQDGTFIQSSGSTLLIRGAPGATVTTTDGSGGDTLVSQSNTTKSTTDLADFAPHGTLTKVIGLDGSEDDFWMRFERVDGEGVVGFGFGVEGIWREWYNVDEPSSLDATTMPHEIVQTSPGVYTIAPADWADRSVGDTETNPNPGFIGQSLRDIGGFQSRLVALSPTVTNMSATNEPNNFFNRSAVTGIATDPIEMSSTAEGEFSLQYIVPFNRDLMIFGNRNQFIISGGQGLTPSNASMVQTTTFEMSEGVRPEYTGRTVLMPFAKGAHSGVKEFFATDVTEANDAVTITELVPKLLKGSITSMVSSTNHDTVLITTDAVEDNIVYVYKYLWDGSNKVQSAWSKWDMVGDVQNIFFNESEVSVLLSNIVAGRGNDFYQVVLDLDLPENEDTGYNLALDATAPYVTTEEYTDPITGFVYSTVVVPLDNLLFRQGQGCTHVGQAVTAFRVEPVGADYRYLFDIGSVPLGARVWGGLDFVATFKPTMPFARDGSGAVMRFVRLVLSRFIIHYDISGPMTATRSSRYRSEDVSVNNDYTLLDLDPDDIDNNGIRSGFFDVPFREQSDISELTITASGGLPITINEIEWVGQSRGGRRRL